jgi:hypothetical protein
LSSFHPNQDFSDACAVFGGSSLLIEENDAGNTIMGSFKALTEDNNERC